MQLKNRTIFVLTTALLFSSSFAIAKPQAETTAKSIDPKNIAKAQAWLPTRINDLMKQTGVPGLAVAVVHDGKVTYSEGFGVRNVETKEKVDPSTVFQLASMSKSLASTVAAGVVGGAGGKVKVNWDDPIQKFFPEFTLKNPKAGANVTIRDMFAHRSGLPYDAAGDLEGFQCNRAQILQKLRYFSLEPLRSKYNYTNFGLTVGAEAVARAEGKSWEDLSDEVLYKPLGMTSTSSRWADYNKRANKADIHIEGAPGKWILSTRDADAQSPSGGASSNVIDMAKWMILQINEGKDASGTEIINRKALLQTREPLIAMSVDQVNVAGSHYGIGIISRIDEAGRLRLRHSGAFSAGAATAYDLLPSEKLGIVVLTNGAPKGIPEAIEQEFYDIVEFGEVKSDRMAALLKMASAFVVKNEFDNDKPPSNAKPGPKASELIGTYKNDYYGDVTIKEQGTGYQFTVNPCGTAFNFELSHWDGNTFSFPVSAEPVVLSALQYIPAKGKSPAKIYVKALDVGGFGTFKRQP